VKNIRHHDAHANHTDDEIIIFHELSQSKHKHELHRLLHDSLAAIVRWPSFTQSIKGIFTVGIVKSIGYAVQKILKATRASK
jgi:hypothetical protein